MTKSKPNHELWKLFTYVVEGLDENTFVMPIEVHGTPALSHTGIAPEDMTVTITKHDYLPMTRIHVDFNIPVEVEEYLNSDDENKPYAAKWLKNWFDTRGPVEYLVYNVMVDTLLEQLREIRTMMQDTERYVDHSEVKKLIGFLANLSMEDVDKTIQKSRNRYYPLVVNRVANVIVDEPSDEWIDKHFGDMTAQDIQHVDLVVNRNAERIAKCLGKIGEFVNEWGEKTKKIKDYDLWFSLNIEDHKIALGLDAQPYRSEEDFVINRSPVKMSEWENDEYDLDVITKVQVQIDKMNVIIGNLLNYNTGYESLNKEINKQYFRAVHHPIAKHTVRVWSFDDVCEEGRAKIDAEISWMLDTITELGLQKGRTVRLDISNMYLHTTEAGEAFILPHDEQVIAQRCQTYSGTFFDALQQHLFDVETDLFGPYTNLKPADLDNQKVITESDLLNPPTIH